MKKRLTILMLLFIIGIYCCACNDTNNEQTEQTNVGETVENEEQSADNQTENEEEISAILPEIKENYFRVFAENTDRVFTAYSCTNTLFFTVLSTEQLTTEDIKVTLDADISYSYDLIMNETPENISYNVFATYQGLVWKDVAQENKEDITALKREIESYRDAYVKSLSKVPKLYQGVLYINLNEWYKQDLLEIKEIGIEVKGEEQIYSFDGISINMAETTYSTSSKLLSDTIAVSDVPVDVSDDGRFYIEDIVLRASDDVAVDKIYFFNCEESTVENVYVSQGIGGMALDYVWDKTTAIEVANGEHVTLNIEATDPIFADTLVANVSRVLMIEYSCNGEKHIEVVDAVFRMRKPAHEMYAEMEDELDYVSYYTEVYPLLYGEKEAE